jgi:hypothetical protein
MLARRILAVAAIVGAGALVTIGAGSAASGAAGAKAAGCPAPSELPSPPADRPTYAMTISFGAAKKVVRGTSRVTFALDRASDRIVFRLWPNMPVQRQVYGCPGARRSGSRRVAAFA